MAPAHPHAERIMEYAKDWMDSPEPWKDWEVYHDATGWMPMTCHPRWHADVRYRRRPESRWIDAFELPTPISRSLQHKDVYYIADFIAGDVLSHIWEDLPYNRNHYQTGLIYDNEPDALKALNALRRNLGRR